MGAKISHGMRRLAQCLGRVSPFFALPPAVRKIIKTRGHFPNDEVATKLIWLALRNIIAGWSRCAQDWKLEHFLCVYCTVRNNFVTFGGVAHAIFRFY